MEDDDQDDKVEVINDEDDDNEDEVLMDTPIGPEAVLMDTAAAAPHLAQDHDDDSLCFHCIQCNLTLASANSFKRHQQSKKHRSKLDAAKVVSSIEYHCDVCNVSI